MHFLGSKSNFVCFLKKSDCQRALLSPLPKGWNPSSWGNTEQLVSLLCISGLLLENKLQSLLQPFLLQLDALSSSHLSCAMWHISKPQPLWNALWLSSQAWHLGGLNAPQSLALGTDYNVLFLYPFNSLLKNKMIIYFPLTSLLKTFQVYRIVESICCTPETNLHSTSIILPE